MNRDTQGVSMNKVNCPLRNSLDTHLIEIISASEIEYQYARCFGMGTCQLAQARKEKSWSDAPLLVVSKAINLSGQSDENILNRWRK